MKPNPKPKSKPKLKMNRNWNWDWNWTDTETEIDAETATVIVSDAETETEHKPKSKLKPIPNPKPKLTCAMLYRTVMCRAVPCCAVMLCFRHRVPEGCGGQRQARHRWRAGGTDAAHRRHLPRRVGYRCRREIIICTDFCLACRHSNTSKYYSTV